MISIISVYNNKKQLDECLLSSLKKQNIEYDLVLIDNTENKFSSAAAALNFGASQANPKSEYFMFVHQDVVFENDDYLQKLEETIRHLSGLGVAGAAGMTGQGAGRGNIKHGDPAKEWELGKKIDEPEVVQTLDECLVIIPRKIFNQYKFDEQICDGWDLYAVDYCLNMQTRGLKVYVVPLNIWHKSIGGAFINNYFKIIFRLGWLSKDYYRAFNKVLKKHKKDYIWIHTTCISFNTRYSLLIQRIWLILKKIKSKVL